MINNIEIYNRSRSLGLYVVENKATVREASKVFGVSKSTVYRDITEHLDKNTSLYKEVRQILNINKEERSARGGESTKKKLTKKKVIN
jgi:putative DeoR family transcriptional regulator (stage III sporulation protein D)